MKKIISLILAMLTAVALLAGCTQEPVEIDIGLPFPTAETVNEMISNMGDVTDKASAAYVIEIIEEYNSLDAISQSKIVDIEKVYETAKNSSEYFEQDTNLRAMSFNLRSGELEPERVQNVVETIRREEPDVIGFQEGTGTMCFEILRQLGDKYEMMAHYKYGGKSEENDAIAYNKQKFTLIDHDTLWLTETPEYKTKHPDTSWYRIFVYQVLERKSDGQRFIHVNTHLDFIGDHICEYQVSNLTTHLDIVYGDTFPIVITGDFNTGINSPAYKVMLERGYEDTGLYGERTRTYHGYREEGGGVIDFIFVNDNLPILSYKVCDEKINGTWVSDHNPIVADLMLFPTSESLKAE